MAWNSVKVSVDGESIHAMLKHDESELEIPNVIEVGDSIKVGKKTYNVLSTTITNNDDLYLTISFPERFFVDIVFKTL